MSKINDEMYLDWGADGALIKACKLDDLKIAIDECSKLQRYKRKFYHRVKVIKRIWKENGGQRELLEKILCLSSYQFSILVDVLESIFEYKRWNELSHSTSEKLSILQVMTDSSNS